MEFELIERGQFEAMALAAGFRVLELHGSYAREPFVPGSSPVQIWELERPG